MNPSMDDPNNMDETFRSALEQFKMNPPANAWDALDADLSRNESAMHKQKLIRYRLLSAILALLLISFIAVQYLLPDANPNHSGLSEKRMASGAKSANAIVKNPHGKTITPDNLIISEKKVAAVNQEDLRITEKKNVLSLFNPNNKATHSNKKPIALNANTTEKQITPIENIVVANAEANNSSITTTVSPDNNTLPLISNIINQENLTGQYLISSTNDSIVKQNIIENTTDYTLTVKTPRMLNHASGDSLVDNKTKNKSPWSIKAFYSPNYSRNHLKKNSSVMDNEEAEFYKNEKSNYSHATGVAIRFDLNNHWNLSAGLNYSTIAYNISLPTIYAKQGTDNDVFYQYPTSCGIIEIPNSDQSILHDGDSLTTSTQCTQVVRFINAPLMIGYRIVINRFTLFADAGVSVNYVLQERAKLRIGSTESTITNHIKGLQKMNYGYLIGTGLQFNLYDNLGIFMEPMFRGSLTSLTRNTGVNCYPYSLGLNAGVSLHF